MKTHFLKNTATAAALFSLAALFAGNASAQTSSESQQSGLTRAQVEAQLAQLEAAGYNPNADDIHYPRGIQAAEARLQASQAAQQTASSEAHNPAGTQQAD